MGIFDSYESGYAAGYDQGRRDGYEQGYLDAGQDYDHRLKKYWVELSTLNARIDYLEKQLDRNNG